MYVREIDGQSLKLVVSGKLWNRSLVMMDQETGGLWSQLLGRCMEGQLKGKELEVLPSIITSWKAWKQAAPKTGAAMMSRTAQVFQRDFHDQNRDRLLVGAVIDGGPRHWAFKQLPAGSTISDDFEGLPLWLTVDEDAYGVRLFERKIDEQALTMRHTNAGWVDEETQTTWDPTSGVGIQGTHRGKKLKALPAIVSFRKAWMTFHPESTGWKPQSINITQD